MKNCLSDDQKACYMAAFAAGKPTIKNYLGILDLKPNVIQGIQYQFFWPRELIVQALEPAALRRTQKFASSRSYSSRADLIGLLGEIGWFKALDFSPEEALADFEKGLKRGDGGVDAVVGRVLLDVKSTMKSDLQLRNTKSNPHYHRATAYGFTYVDFQPEGVIISLLGWAYRADIRQYCHADTSGKYEFLRLWSLSRDGLIMPVRKLLDMEERGHHA